MRVATQGYRSQEAMVAGGRRSIELSLQTSRTGLHEMFRVDVMGEAFGVCWWHRRCARDRSRWRCTRSRGRCAGAAAVPADRAHRHPHLASRG